MYFSTKDNMYMKRKTVIVLVYPVPFFINMTYIYYIIIKCIKPMMLPTDKAYLYCKYKLSEVFYNCVNFFLFFFILLHGKAKNVKVMNIDYPNLMNVPIQSV